MLERPITNLAQPRLADELVVEVRKGLLEHRPVAIDDGDIGVARLEDGLEEVAMCAWVTQLLEAPVGGDVAHRPGRLADDTFEPRRVVVAAEADHLLGAVGSHVSQLENPAGDGLGPGGVVPLLVATAEFGEQ